MHKKFSILSIKDWLSSVFHASSVKDSNSQQSSSNFADEQTSDNDWQEQLSEDEYYILREEGTEHPFSSDLYYEERDGLYVCLACSLPLFKSETKYQSGTGWPSFFDYIRPNLAMKDDYKLSVLRTEYHCARCGAHQGHVFNDGPEPTGLRYCNNGTALKFIPKD